MSELIINQGAEDHYVSSGKIQRYGYVIGSGSILGDGVEHVNDPKKLHEIAVELRDDYSQWIYSLNAIFLRNDLVRENLSLFLISDCSCKRTELFDTYAIVCNLVLIQEIYNKYTPQSITIVGAEANFIRAVQSV